MSKTHMKSKPKILQNPFLISASRSPPREATSPVPNVVSRIAEELIDMERDFDGNGGKLQVPLKRENGQTAMVPLFQSQENVAGEVVIEPVQGKKLEQNGVKIELLGQIGPWKHKNLSEHGIVTQCIAPTRFNDQYVTNVLLKINAKLGGLNLMLVVEHSPSIPMVSKNPILRMDVSHGSLGQSDIPSIIAVVSSTQWLSISHYRASVHTQSPKVEMIDSLHKRVSDTKDEGIVRELLLDFYTSSRKMKPDQIIIFRLVI